MWLLNKIKIHEQFHDFFLYKNKKKWPLVDKVTTHYIYILFHQILKLRKKKGEMGKKRKFTRRGNILKPFLECGFRNLYFDWGSIPLAQSIETFKLIGMWIIVGEMNWPKWTEEFTVLQFVKCLLNPFVPRVHFRGREEQSEGWVHFLEGDKGTQI